MNKLVTLAVVIAAAASAVPALAASAASTGTRVTDRAPSEAQARQQNRMARCNQEATGQKGAERKAFMKQCLSASKAPAPAEAGGKPTRKAAR